MMNAEDRVDRAVNNITYAGAGVGFLAYLVFGVIPGLLYGGYAGLFLAGAMLGTPVEPTLVVKAITFGGILFGALAALFIFLVAGAFMGSMASLIARPFLRIHAHHAEAAELASKAATVQERMEVPVHHEAIAADIDVTTTTTEDSQVRV